MRKTANSILIDLPVAEAFQYATAPTYLSKWVANENQTVVAGHSPFEIGLTQVEIAARSGNPPLQRGLLEFAKMCLIRKWEAHEVAT